MNEARLYFKLEKLSNGDTKFHYYTGVIGKGDESLASFDKIVDSAEMQNISTTFEDAKDQILYYVNLMEYLRLIKEYDDLVLNQNDTISETQLKKDELRKQILTAIRLKGKFKYWFEKNGFKVPDTRELI